MANLYVHGMETSSIFELIGTDENSITKSLAWSFKQCPQFFAVLADSLFSGININPESTSIIYQKYDADTGITDLEITDRENFYFIVEAKKGWILPGKEQIERYSKRKDFIESQLAVKAVISLSECSTEYASLHLKGHTDNGIPVKHISWKQLYDTACNIRSTLNNSQKHLIEELKEYLQKIMSAQSKDSNWVYVVSISNGMASDSVSWKDIVQKYNKYFHPVGGNGWPVSPPNYIAFRYDGRLQSIHHIENYTVSTNLHEHIPAWPDEETDKPLYVYDLGAAIVPSKTVKTGNIFLNGRVWAMIDTLLTADTISEARDISQART